MANPILQRGSKFRDAVARLQLALQGAGFSVKIDGAYGRGTENAVKALSSEGSGGREPVESQLEIWQTRLGL